MKIFIFMLVFLLVFSFITIPVYSQDLPAFVRNEQLIKSDILLPIVKDPDFVVEEYVSGLSWPTTMTFVGDDILVLEKISGKVRLIRDGILDDEPVLEVNINPIVSSGLLGILAQDSTIFLYFTEINPETKETIGNQVYKYNWNGEKLINPQLVQSLPWGPWGETQVGSHVGGVLVQNNDGVVFAAIGDLRRQGILQNFPTGEPDDSGVIFELESDDPYYAIGIRNSFGLAVDPITGNIWDTENGSNRFDEINLVEPRFNSGWEPIQGMSKQGAIEKLPEFRDFVYSEPEFVWDIIVSPTALTFIESDKFGKYKNSLFVSDFLNGFIYQFKLNEKRDSFVFDESLLTDLVLDRGEPINEIIFGIDFGGITDMKFGPDGNLYVVSIIDGKIYKIAPSENQSITSDEPECDIAPRPRINWSGCDFSDLVLKGIDLRFADLRKTNFTGSDLSGSYLSYANLSNSIMKNTNLENSKMVVTSLTDADLSNSQISRTNLSFSDLNGANLENSTLKKSFLKGGNLENANFNNVDLSDAVLKNSKAEFSSFKNANMSKVDLRYSDFINVELQDATMIGIILHSVNLTNSNLSGANLDNVFAHHTDYTNTVFSEESIVNTCLGDSFMDHAINESLKRIRNADLSFLDPIDSFLAYLCKP